MQAFLVKLLRADDLEAALDAFHAASTMEKGVRLAAASHVGEFRNEAFRAFVDEWIAREPDDDVRAALGAARRKASEVPGWHALQATGAPNADPARDDRNAWAWSRGDVGEQWLELAYETPLRASAVRIFEVNSAGAVARVVGIEPGGARHLLWEGLDPTATPGVLEVRFATTAFRIARVLVVLDTDRAPGWNEIDAVELVGPDGRAWADGGSASSSYGS